MRKIICRPSLFFVLLAVLVLTPARSSAADFPPVSPDDMKIKEVPGYPGAPAIVLYHEEIDDDIMHYQEIYSRIKILTEAGREYANVQIPYTRKNGGKLGDIMGRTIHADGSIVVFEGKPFDKVIEKGRDRKYSVKAFTLPDVQVGSIIEYRYTFRYDDDSLYTPHWNIQTDLFQNKVHFAFKPYMGDVRGRHDVISRGVKWTYSVPKNTEPKLVRDQCIQRTGSDRSCEKVVYDATNVAPFIEEPYMPPSQILKDNVTFYYDSNRKQDEFWKSEGKYWTKDIDQFLGDESALRDELAKIISPTDTDEQKVRKIHAHVGTYTNLTYSPSRSLQELQAIGLDKKYSVEKVIKAKTGDREDLNRLFIGLVRQAGIPAYAVRVTARDDSYFVPQVLDWDQLNMELAIVRLNDKEVFLDPGTRFCPYGLLYWKVSATNGVRQSASGKGTEIASTPQPSHLDSQIKRLAEFKMLPDGSAKGQLQIAFIGQEALLRRINASKTDADGRTKMLEDQVKGWLPSIAEVTLVNKPEWEDSDKPLIATFRISTPLTTAAGRRQLLPTHVLDFNRPAMFPHAERKYTIYLDFPYSSSDEIRVTLPPGILPENLPAPSQVQLGYAVYQTSCSMEGRDMVSSTVMGLGGFAFEASKYSDIKGFFEKVKEGNDQQIVLRSLSASGAANAEGK